MMNGTSSMQEGPHPGDLKVPDHDDSSFLESVKATTGALLETPIVDDEDDEDTQSPVMKSFKRNNEGKMIGLKHHANTRSRTAPIEMPSESVEKMEKDARKYAKSNVRKIFLIGTYAAVKVFLYYLITLETILGIALTTGLTCYWYYDYRDNVSWTGVSLDFILLAFAVTSPIAAALTMAFNRREQALFAIGEFRASAQHIFIAHCFWDTDKLTGGRKEANVDWLEHCDAVMAQLIGIGDELSRFLSLPTSSRSRHRMTRSGRKEAAKTMKAAYHLMESLATQRIARLVLYSERLKRMAQVPGAETSRLRQFERFLSTSIEHLRMVKMYRTPQALRSFARIFTLILPPFYAPTFAQVGKDVASLTVGILFGIITVVCLTALFESVQVLEDPFTAFLALDGIDVHEEFEVLHYAQLVNTRSVAFPHAPPYPAGRRAALLSHQSPDKVDLLLQIPTHGRQHAHSETDESTRAETDVGEYDVELGAVMDDSDGDTVRDTDYVEERFGNSTTTDDSGRTRPLSASPPRPSSVVSVLAGRVRRSTLGSSQTPLGTGTSLRSIVSGHGSSGRSRRTSVVASGYDGDARRRVWD